jgi:hypothetical protein
MNYFRSSIIMLLVSAALCGCVSSNHHQTLADMNVGPTTMRYSPIGEPLNGGPLGRPKCDIALAVWFARVDTDHNNVIDHDEYIADATAQFSRMDTDHNGYLLPEELERYGGRIDKMSIPHAMRPRRARTMCWAATGEVSTAPRTTADAAFGRFIPKWNPRSRDVGRFEQRL